MGRSSILASISESLSARARKLRITVEYNGPSAMRTLVRGLVKILRANPQWCSLDVRLEDYIPNPMRNRIFPHKGDEICLNAEILRPLYLLRRLEHIEVTGVSPQFAAELSELVKSDRPIIDLEKMYDSLTRYAYGSVNGDADERGVFSGEDMKLAENANRG